MILSGLKMYGLKRKKNVYLQFVLVPSGTFLWAVTKDYFVCLVGKG